MEKSKARLVDGIIVILIISIILLIIGFIGIFKINKAKNEGIETYSLATYNVWNYELKNTKYKLTNENELEIFYKAYSGFEEMINAKYKEIMDCDFTKNTIFIEKRRDASGLASLELKNVSFTLGNNLKFNISESNKSNISLNTDVYWYFIAIIPNDKLEGIDTEEWKLPSESIKTDWKITVYMTGIRSSDVEKIIKEIKQEGEQFIYNEVKVNGVVQDIAVDKIEIITNDVIRYKELTKWFNDKEYVEKINTEVSSTEINKK